MDNRIFNVNGSGLEALKAAIAFWFTMWGFRTMFPGW